jgi:hypothetical protein
VIGAVDRALDRYWHEQEPPKRAKAFLAERDSAEQSALAQLDAIVEAHSTK